MPAHNTGGMVQRTPFGMFTHFVFPHPPIPYTLNPVPTQQNLSVRNAFKGHFFGVHFSAVKGVTPRYQACRTLLECAP